MIRYLCLAQVEIKSFINTSSVADFHLAIGWNKKERIYGGSIHLDIKNKKIWIQINNTELDIGQDLFERGIPKEDIVIGFQPPYLRQYSGYAAV
jgi:XisI protein